MLGKVLAKKKRERKNKADIKDTNESGAAAASRGNRIENASWPDMPWKSAKQWDN